MDNPQTIGGVEQTEFPACMLPDGGDPCRAFQLLQSQIEHQLSVIGEKDDAIRGLLSLFDEQGICIGESLDPLCLALVRAEQAISPAIQWVEREALNNE